MLRALLPYPAQVACLAALLVLAQAACAREGSVQTRTAADTLVDAAPYAFDRPAALFRLPGALKEISGLTVLDEGLLGAIQDEKGRLYLIDLETGDVKGERDFGKNLDYEGVERVGHRVFILQSDGDLFEIEDWRGGNLDAKRRKTGLGEAYDTEGLGYDAARNRLLIACKEYAGKGLKHKKAIYAYDLDRGALLDEPAYVIDIKAFNARMASGGGLNERIRDAVQPVLDLSGFKPSALAVHPHTGEVYVLSSVRKAIVVLEPDGALQAVWPLSDPPFEQPEGMAFLPSGDLFIASEGVGDKAVLARFTYRPTRE